MENLNNEENRKIWDAYFLDICGKVAENSKCLSRQIGAVLVRDKVIIATGYNGPPRGVPPCNIRHSHDPYLIGKYMSKGIENFNEYMCPRRILGFESGTGLEWCVSIHAEKNCILSAARLGIETKGATLYANMKISPCSQCFGAMINAGIKEVVLLENILYDDSVKWLSQSNSDITIRTFEL